MPFKILSFLITILLLISCQKKDRANELILPTYSPLESSVSWAVVRVPYLRIQPSIEAKSEVSAILREGEVVKILQVRSIFERQLGVWQDYYEVEATNQETQARGWISSDLVDVFQYEEAARRNSTS